MTTGRINQVTILSPSAEAHERTPRRRPGCTGRKGRRRSEPQPQASQVCETPEPHATDSIPPTEFPKLRPATTDIRSLHRSLHRYIRHSAADDPHQLNAQARALDSAVPEALVQRLATPVL